MDAWLNKAAAHGKSKGYEGDQRLTSRLAPDSYPLVRQMQAVCDGARLAYAILRHNGVDLGKLDFLGSLNLRDA